MGKKELKQLVDKLWEAESKETMEQLLQGEAPHREELIRHYQAMQEQWLLVAAEGKMVKVLLKHIRYAKADSQYCYAYLSDVPNHYLHLSHNLHWLEEKLTDCGFVRICDKYLVNLLEIKNTDLYYTELTLSNEVTLPVDTEYRDVLKKALLLLA